MNLATLKNWLQSLKSNQFSYPRVRALDRHIFGHILFPKILFPKDHQTSALTHLWWVLNYFFYSICLVWSTFPHTFAWGRPEYIDVFYDISHSFLQVVKF